MGGITVMVGNAFFIAICAIILAAICWLVQCLYQWKLHHRMYHNERPHSEIEMNNLTEHGSRGTDGSSISQDLNDYLANA